MVAQMYQTVSGTLVGHDTEKDLRCLVALDRDVEIIVKPRRDGGNAPALQVF